MLYFQYEENMVTPENFLDVQMSQALYFLMTGKFVLSDDELEDIVMSENFRNYQWKKRDADFTNIVRETDLIVKRKMAEDFLAKYNF